MRCCRVLALLCIGQCNGLTPVLPALRALGSGYATLATQHPLAASAATAGGILCAADLTCQSVLEREKPGTDARRTAALTVFGAWHYGVPAKLLYLAYDRILGTTPTLANSIAKMLIDVYLHTPLLVIPSFYFITFAIRGRSMRNTAVQLKRE